MAFLLLGCQSASSSAVSAPSAVEFFTSPDPALAALPFSEVVKAGNLLFLAGQIGTQPGSLSLVAGGFAPEAKQTLENICSILERHGCSTKDVVKCTVFLADMKDWPAFNELYRQVFKAPFPARSALGTNGLALGARVEVECIAVIPPGSHAFSRTLR